MLHQFIVYLQNSGVCNSALLIGILCGVCAVLVDVDHLASLVLDGRTSRMWHTPLLTVSLCVAGYCIARIGGLLVKLVLS